jgi:hypothetical protein
MDGTAESSRRRARTLAMDETQRCDAATEAAGFRGAGELRALGPIAGMESVSISRMAAL